MKALSLPLSPVGPEYRSLQSVLQPGYSESPDAQPSSLCWGSARPLTRICRILWPHERQRAKSLSFRMLQKKAKISCTYCPRLMRSALTFPFQVGSIISKQNFRILQCLGIYRCIRHCTGDAILYMFGLQTKWEHIKNVQTDRTHRKHIILLTPMHKTQLKFGQIYFWLKWTCYVS